MKKIILLGLLLSLISLGGLAQASSKTIEKTRYLVPGNEGTTATVVKTVKLTPANAGTVRDFPPTSDKAQPLLLIIGGGLVATAIFLGARQKRRLK